MKRFVDQVAKALADCLEPWLTESVWIDKDRLHAGDLIDDALAGALCRSVCMIVLYSPTYQHHKYCLRELKAMQILQERRMRMLERSFGRDRGLIIPLVLRGTKEDLPEDIRHVHFGDFSTFSLHNDKLADNPLFVAKIDEIARFIYEMHTCFQQVDCNPCADCGSFQLPPESDVEPWQLRSRAVMPF
jgi:hypothetical protein